MFTATRTISVPATLRSSVSVKSASGQPSYDCQINSAVISDGWADHMAKATQLMLDPSLTDFDNRILILSNPRLIFAKETTTLSVTSEPPASDIVTITPPDLDVTRLDTSNTDDQATLEFRITDVALPAISGQTTTDFNRIYLVATSSMAEYNTDPAYGSGGVTEPGVVHDNVAGDQTFDESTDLYVLAADSGAIVVDSNTYPVWIKRTDILSDPTWSGDVVLGAVDLRNTSADDVELDILRGSATALCDATFRIVV